jgi:triacylglycerol esterase/lipase EstA (alpha/beta hydrolase family)
MYHGKLGNFWSEPVKGEQIQIRLITDKPYKKSGFIIDKIRVKKNIPEKKENQAALHEFDSKYESQHNINLYTGNDWSEVLQIKQPGAREILVHFSLISINSGCEKNINCPGKIEILNEKNELVKGFTNNTFLKDTWVTVSGSIANINFNVTKNKSGILPNHEDASHLMYGYKIDKIKVKSDYPVFKYSSRYPVVFAHGLFGFNKIMGLDYFFRVQKYLEDRGYEVYMTEVPPVSSLQTRADILEKQINQILAESSHKNGRKVDKVNFIAHSMGGLDGRVLISKNTEGNSTNPDEHYKIKGKDMGDKFAAFVTIGTPHFGTLIADILQGWVPNQDVRKTTVAIIKLLSTIYNYSVTNEKEVVAASFELTEKFAKQFNIDHPEPRDKKINYMTFAGITQAVYPQREDADEVNLLLFPTFLILALHPDESMRENDGLISLESAKWKDEYYRTYQGKPLMADHLNEVGHIMGHTDQNFNHLDFYNFVAKQFE